MVERRSILLHGLSLTLRRFPALLWTYIANLALALLFSIGINRELAHLLNNSLAAQRLSSGFDLGAIGEIFLHTHQGPIGDAAGIAGHASIPVFLLVYFLLVPGTLFCYLTDTPARLGTLLQQGLLHLWRFVRITILTVIASAIILVPLMFFQGRWADYIDEQLVGRLAFLCALAGYIIILLVASALRLYFDLVEVYTVQLGLHLRPATFDQSKPDRRVLHALAPAWRTLRAHRPQAWAVFLFLTLLGASAVILTARISMHMLAQPRVWPTFLIAQFGLFFMLFTRFWQRGAETSLALQNPIANPTIADAPAPLHPNRRAQLAPEPPVHTPTLEPISDPEPASPSLDGPDPGVFHHNPTRPPQ